MPELPEVETIRRQIEPLITGRRIIDAWSFGTPKFEQTADAVDHRITGVGRRGKYLILDLTRGFDLADADDVDSGGIHTVRTDKELILHLGMTGRLSTRDEHPAGSFPGATRPVHRRAEWLLDDDLVLEFTDIRRFGRISVVDAGEHGSIPTLAAMGPEPFDADFDGKSLHTALLRSRQSIKTQLMSQRVVAGLGNIYVDESLWLARVHPDSRRITVAEAQRLHDAIITTLESGLANGGTTLRDYRDLSGNTGSNQLGLECYGRAGEPCNRCGRTLERLRIAGRTTTFCSRCQRRRL